MRNGSYSWLLLPWVAAAGALGFLLLQVRLASAQDEQELASLVGGYLGPAGMTLAGAMVSSLVIARSRKVRAGNALRAVDFDPRMRSQAYRIALRECRSVKGWLQNRAVLEEQIIERAFSASEKA